jgi:hypothetical protein
MLHCPAFSISIETLRGASRCSVGMRNGWVDLALLPFFSMVDRRTSLHHDVFARTRGQFPELLTTEVPYSSEIERMSERRAPLPSYSPRSVVGQIYSALWMEIGARLTHRISTGATASVHGHSS